MGPRSKQKRRRGVWPGLLLLPRAPACPLLVHWAPPTPLHDIFSLNFQWNHVSNGISLSCSPWLLVLQTPRSCFKDQMKCCMEKSFGNTESKKVIFRIEKRSSALQRAWARALDSDLGSMQARPLLLHCGDKWLPSPSLKFPSDSSRKVSVSQIVLEDWLWWYTQLFKNSPAHGGY